MVYTHFCYYEWLCKCCKAVATWHVGRVSSDLQGKRNQPNGLAEVATFIFMAVKLAKYFFLESRIFLFSLVFTYVANGNWARLVRAVWDSISNSHRRHQRGHVYGHRSCENIPGSRSATDRLLQTAHVWKGGWAAAGPLRYHCGGRHPIRSNSDQTENVRSRLEWTIWACSWEQQVSHSHSFPWRCHTPRCFRCKLHDTFRGFGIQGKGWGWFLGECHFHSLIIFLIHLNVKTSILFLLDQTLWQLQLVFLLITFCIVYAIPLAIPLSKTLSLMFAILWNYFYDHRQLTHYFLCIHWVSDIFKLILLFSFRYKHSFKAM